MRSGFLALLFCVPAAAMCQSTVPGAGASESPNGRQALPPWTACNHLAAAISAECVSPQFDLSNRAYSGLSSKAVQPASGLLPQNNASTLLLEPPPRGAGKSEPIPTQWPQAKPEKIPTQWPQLSMMPIHSASDALATVELAPR
jgi:hypothetical protein